MKETRIDVQFAYGKGSVPTYVNAAVLTVSPDRSFVIDFGFVDPLLIHQMQIQAQEVSQTDEHYSENDKNIILKVTADSLTRVALSQEVAKSLLQQIQRVLELMESSNKENEDVARNT